MQLSIREAASYLNVDEATLRRWIRTRGVPVHRADERLHLNAIELWEWATENGVPVSQRLLDQARRQPEEVPALSSLLVTGGIHYEVAGETKSAVLRQIVTLLPLPPDVDREFLGTVLEAREAMGSTGIGDGIAIPHVRNPILLHVPAPFVTLCLLHHAVEFDAVDGKPVHALFSVISPTVPAHLRILAQLAVVLRDGELRQLLSSRGTADRILSRIRALEARATGAHAAASNPA